jgi:serine/threonine protein kinase
MSNSEFPGLQILGEIGRGTTGIVYKARDLRLDRVVALKTLSSVDNDTHSRAKKLVREARVLAALTHQPDDNIPTIHAVMEFRGQPCSMREFVDGETLAALATSSRITLPAAIQSLALVAGAVARVHDLGIAHNNLHPLNILVAADGTPKLIGFGQVGLLSRTESQAAGEPCVPAEVDIDALQRLIIWLCSALRQDLPRDLEPVSRPGAFQSPLDVQSALDQCVGDWAH